MAVIPMKVISDMSEKICENHGAYLYDLQYVKEGPKKVLRIFADKDGGIGIDLCEKISRDISAFLDEMDLINEAYSLEVSSPGAERKLRSDKHFSAVLNKKICISLYSPIDNQKNFTGMLKKADSDTIVLDCEGTEMTVEKSKIAQAHLYFDVNEYLRSIDN